VRRKPIVFDNAKRPPTGGPPLENHVIAMIAVAVLVREWAFQRRHFKNYKMEDILSFA